MNSRATTRELRTSATDNPRTLGERIRYARLDLKISQEDLASRINRITGGNITKSLVSRWERDAVKNPTNENILALAAVTSFRVEWLIRGKEPRKATVPSKAETAGLNDAQLARAIETAMGAMKIRGVDSNRAAAIISRLYETLCDTPGLDDQTLKIVAGALARP